jgi:hypothetical protein
MGGAYSAHGGDEKCVHYFGWRAWEDLRVVGG